MTVLDLLEEIEDIVDKAPGVPLTGKVMVDADELRTIVMDIRKSLPDDVHQAQWIKEEKERILAEARAEYERLIKEAQKQADYLVDTNDITVRARKVSEEIIQNAQVYSRELKMRTYDYMDKILFDMENKMDEFGMKLFGEMYGQLEKSMENVNGILKNNREEIKTMAYNTQQSIEE
ncbi:MAG: ATPase [Clostridia bacterium]|nr:ATPase [Clostridia bacterium]